MKDLWNRTFEMFRSHIVLWVPCSTAAILLLVLGRLEKAGIHWLIGFFSTHRSVLGGEVSSGDLTRAQHRTMLVVYPLGTLLDLLEICLVVVAFIATKNLLQMVLEERTPNMIDALRGTAQRYREVLLFSLKYMVVLVGLEGAPLLLASYLLPSEHFREFALSKESTSAFFLAAQACLAWLLVPAAIRLLRPPGSPAVSTQERGAGTFFAVAASAGSLVLQYLIGKAEVAVMFDNRFKGGAIAVANTIIINAPQVLLFIALALLATQGSQNGGSLVTEPEISWSSRLSDWVRRAREWRGGSS